MTYLIDRGECNMLQAYVTYVTSLSRFQVRHSVLAVHSPLYFWGMFHAEGIAFSRVLGPEVK